MDVRARAATFLSGCVVSLTSRGGGFAPRHLNRKITNQLTEAEIKPLLVSLRSHIYNFVTNPLFETSGVIDVELSKKASNDLNQIIGFSESINKCADKLKKPDE